MSQFPLANPHSGALFVDKPVGLTSSDVVVKLKKALSQNGYFEKGFRIGHGGTLDPFASGVLVVLTGEATKLADAYLHSKKTYTGVIQLGIQTDTADHTGTILKDEPLPQSAKLSTADWNQLAQTFVNEPYWQTPPMYSAKKIDGQVLHQLARQGIEVERQPILKKIFSFSVERMNDTQLSFSVSCESGTYVRVIAEDLANKAHTHAHLKTLVRAQSSDAHLSQTLSLASLLEKLEAKISLSQLPNFKSLSQVATHLKSIEINPLDSESVRFGMLKTNQAILRECQNSYPQERYVLVKNSTGPVALLENPLETKVFRIQRVFNPISETV